MKARVVDIIRESEPVRFKVHFNGWKAKHDEWLDAGSARLAALGQHTEVVMVDVVKPPQIPWYENSAILSLVSLERCARACTEPVIIVLLFFRLRAMILTNRAPRNDVK